jgi:creatinine amidohydrolase
MSPGSWSYCRRRSEFRGGVIIRCMSLAFYRSTFLALVLAAAASAQQLPVRWEELTAGDFVKAIQKSQGTCVLPFGVLEKHGPHLPIGNDLINARWASLRGAEQEYSLVFPEYYFGQIFEAKQQPGTIAYSAKLQFDLLQETTDEMARNGCKKILIVNGHGGNTSLLPFFAQSQLAAQKDYIVYVYARPVYGADRPRLTTKVDQHAGESETSKTMVTRPDLVHRDRAKGESGADLARLDLPEGVYTGIWWYARFPNHYAGDGSAGNQALGEYDMREWAKAVAGALRAIKADRMGLQLQNEFFERAKKPLETKQP